MQNQKRYRTIIIIQSIQTFSITITNLIVLLLLQCLCINNFFIKKEKKSRTVAALEHQSKPPMARRQWFWGGCVETRWPCWFLIRRQCNVPCSRKMGSSVESVDGYINIEQPALIFIAVHCALCICCWFLRSSLFVFCFDFRRSSRYGSLTLTNKRIIFFYLVFFFCEIFSFLADLVGEVNGSVINFLVAKL